MVITDASFSFLVVGDEATPTCRFKKKACVQSAFRNWKKLKSFITFLFLLKKLPIHFADDFYQKDVNCPVNCNTTSYTADISRGHFPNRDFRASRMARNIKALINDTYLQLSPNRSCNPETCKLKSCLFLSDVETTWPCCTSSSATAAESNTGVTFATNGRISFVSLIS